VRAGEAATGAMVAAARASGKLLMVAHVLPFFPEFAFAADAVKSGRYGALRAACLKRVIARPDWSRGIAEVERSGGPAVDLHIHDTHYIGLVCGVPRGVQSRGVVEGNAVVHLDTHYLYDDGGPVVSALSGALSQSGRSFTHGFEFYLERATLAYDFANMGGEGHLATPLSVILPDGTVEHPPLGSGDPIDAFADELTQAVEAVASGRPAPGLSCDLARDALSICHAEVESVKTGKPVMIG
jgi:predicted dehydrogenase